MQINSFKSHFIPNICMHLRIEYVVFRKEKINLQEYITKSSDYTVYYIFYRYYVQKYY